MSSYHGDDMLGVEPRRELLESIRDAILKHLDREKVNIEDLYLVGSGISGVAMASVLSYMLRCRWGFVRKPTDIDNHGNDGGSSALEDDYIIAVDDFVYSGDTMRRIAQDIEIDAVAVDSIHNKERAKWVHNVLVLHMPDIKVITPHDYYPKETT